MKKSIRTCWDRERECVCVSHRCVEYHSFTNSYSQMSWSRVVCVSLLCLPLSLCLPLPLSSSLSLHSVIPGWQTSLQLRRCHRRLRRHTRSLLRSRTHTHLCMHTPSTPTQASLPSLVSTLPMVHTHPIHISSLPLHSCSFLCSHPTLLSSPFSHLSLFALQNWTKKMNLHWRSELTSQNGQKNRTPEGRYHTNTA